MASSRCERIRADETRHIPLAGAATVVRAGGTFVWGVGDEVGGAALAARPDVHDGRMDRWVGPMLRRGKRDTGIDEGDKWVRKSL